MINEISQNMAGLQPPQKRGASGGGDSAQVQRTVDASRVAELEKRESVQVASSATVEKEELEEAVNSLNEFAQSVKRQLEFSVDKDSGKTIVKVIDSETGETIRDIPSEEVRSMQKHMKELSEQFFGKDTASPSLLFNGKA
jgi:flagellar protein FlaG